MIVCRFEAMIITVDDSVRMEAYGGVLDTRKGPRTLHELGDGLHELQYLYSRYQYRETIPLVLYSFRKRQDSVCRCP